MYRQHLRHTCMVTSVYICTLLSWIINNLFSRILSFLRKKKKVATSTMLFVIEYVIMLKQLSVRAASLQLEHSFCSETQSIAAVLTNKEIANWRYICSTDAFYAILLLFVQHKIHNKVLTAISTLDQFLTRAWWKNKRNKLALYLFLMSKKNELYVSKKMHILHIQIGIISLNVITQKARKN